MTVNVLRKVFGTPESDNAFLAAWTICKVSGHDDKNLIRAIVTYFENFTCFVELMKWIITKEVEGMHASEGTVPFREDSVSTALLLHFNQTSTVCVEYLKKVIKPTILKIKAISDQQQRGTREGLKPRELLDLSQEIIDCVTGNLHEIPPPHMEIMKHVGHRVRDMFGSSRVVNSAVVSMFLLRFVFRSITFPDNYFDKKKVVSFVYRKNLTKVSKVLQKLAAEDEANGEAGGLDIPDIDPHVVGEFVKSNRRKVRTFLEDLLALPVQVAPKRWSEGAFKPASKVIAEHIVENADKLRAEVPQLFSPSVTTRTAKSRANSVESEFEVLQNCLALENLNACLQNQAARDIYFKFATAEHSELPLMFWIEADRYSKNPTKDYALNIFNKYLENGADNQMDIPSKQRTALREAITNPEVDVDATLFAAVQSSFFKNMAQDSYVRFVESVKATAEAIAVSNR